MNILCVNQSTETSWSFWTPFSSHWIAILLKENSHLWNCENVHLPEERINTTLTVIRRNILSAGPIFGHDVLSISALVLIRSLISDVSWSVRMKPNETWWNWYASPSVSFSRDSRIWQQFFWNMLNAAECGWMFCTALFETVRNEWNERVLKPIWHKIMLRWFFLPSLFSIYTLQCQQRNKCFGILFTLNGIRGWKDKQYQFHCVSFESNKCETSKAFCLQYKDIYRKTESEKSSWPTRDQIIQKVRQITVSKTFSLKLFEFLTWTS